MKTLEVIYIQDGDSYVNVWLNNVNHVYSSDNLRHEDVFRMIEKWVDENDGVDKIILHTFSSEAYTGDFPKDLTTVEEMQKWHLDETGEEMSSGY